MSKYQWYISAVLKAVIVAVLVLAGGCAAPNSEGFAIYLTRGDVTPAQMPVLSQVDIAEAPLIALDDIVTYCTGNAGNHEIELTSDAFERVARLDVPVRGRVFVVCVDRKPIYWGAFWTPVSSMSFDGVTIWKPLNSQTPGVIRLQLGYPSPSFYGEEDPRNNTAAMKSLADAGKLTRLQSEDGLPHSMKGYELYSWPEDGQWHFSLITGTNRNKTLDEIVSGPDTVAEGGWVHLRVAGIEAVKSVLRRLPENESVTWLASLRESGGAGISLPQGPAIDEVSQYARARGLDFKVVMP
jgi:hypothetical protein